MNFPPPKSYPYHKDDTTFHQECKNDLISVMTNSTVITNLAGGHLALLIKLEQYADLVTSYIKMHP